MHEIDASLLDKAGDAADIGEPVNRLLATGSVTISPPAFVTSSAMWPPSVATSA
jgi:hypothetical protein